MSIAHLSYVRCDCCGDPAQPGDDAQEARQIAKAEGFTCMAADLCSKCIKPGHEPCEHWHWLRRAVVERTRR